MPELRQRIAHEVEQERRRQVEKDRGRHRYAQTASASAAKALGRALREAVAAAEELRRHRELVEVSSRSLAANLTEADMPVELVDEPSFPAGTAGLIELLQAGPVRPVEDGERRRAEAAETATRQAQEALAWFERNPSRRTLDLLPSNLRDQAEAILVRVQAEHAEAHERMQATLREREFERV